MPGVRHILLQSQAKTGWSHNMIGHRIFIAVLLFYVAIEMAMGQNTTMVTTKTITTTAKVTSNSSTTAPEHTTAKVTSTSNITAPTPQNNSEIFTTVNTRSAAPSFAGSSTFLFVLTSSFFAFNTCVLE